MAVVGIDLGTTASAIAHIRNGKPTVIHIHGNATTPSVVNYSEQEAVVGKEAISSADPLNTVFSIKRFMGSESMFCSRTPSKISADILSFLKENAEKNIGESIDCAVITVPAHFSDLQRTATKQAASISGIKVLRLINEPTAAAIAFGLEKCNDGIFAVYDFGGGTFDFSVLRLMDGVFQVLATGGDNYLGGDDIDNAIVDYNFQLLGIEASREKNSAKLAAKFLKEQLQELPEIRKSYENHEFHLSQDILQKITQRFLQKSLKIADQVLKDARLKASDLDGVVMVGGMTKLKFIKDEVQKHFQSKIFDDINPEEAVALGAAIYADSLTFKNNNMLLIDVVSLTLGVETLGGGVDKIIHRNTPIPIVEKREYTTYQDNQTGIKFHVVQGERSLADECRSLAKFELNGIPPMPAGMPRIIVEFSVDVNGLLKVSAFEKKTGLSQNLIVDPSSGLSQEKMIEILSKAMEHQEEDAIIAHNIAVKIESEKMIKFWELLIKKIPSEMQKTAEIELTKIREALKLEQYQEVINQRKVLEDLLNPFIS
ncbi:MAG: Hsp70 family protein [Holosporaceae bacterium]|jgi:molecular chaperone HscA|nr:Hsp70 family protein [Holosporaceae bacterium]